MKLTKEIQIDSNTVDTETRAERTNLNEIIQKEPFDRGRPLVGETMELIPLLELINRGGLKISAGIWELWRLEGILRQGYEWSTSFVAHQTLYAKEACLNRVKEIKQIMLSNEAWTINDLKRGLGVK